MISVIIPCYNCESFLPRAIESVLAQTYDNWELLLIDNNSTDNTASVIQNYSNKYPGKIFGHIEKKRGAPAARNKGLTEAKGHWVQYLDADDELLPDKLATQFAVAEKGLSDCIVGNCCVVGKRDGVEYRITRPLNKEDVWIALINSHLGITSAILWKTELLKKAGSWDEARTSSQEYELMFRVLKAGGKIDFSDEVQTLIHKADSSISLGKSLDKTISIADNRIRLRLEIEQHLKNTNQLNQERSGVLRKYIGTELLINKLTPDQVPSLKMRPEAFVIPLDLKIRFYGKKILKRLGI